MSISPHTDMTDEWLITGTVYWGHPMNALRRGVVNRYRMSHNWLFRGGSSKQIERDLPATGPALFAPRWTKDERAAFRKWRAEFMKGEGGGRKKSKKKSRQGKV